MTEQISAAQNHAIQITEDYWRLLVDDRPTAEASPIGLRYGGKFAQNRRLPGNGILDRDQLLQVVLGWQETDEAWHLGLIVHPALAEQRGSRWVELASWPDPDIRVFEDVAKSAGQQLAAILGLQFYPIPARRSETPLVASHPLPDLPVTFGIWEFNRVEQNKRQFVIRRLPVWMRQRAMRIAWLSLWTVVYFVLSIATLTSDIALPNAGTLLPNPLWLPYLGIATGFLLIALIAHQIWLILRQPDQFLVDSVEGEVRALRGTQPRWTLSARDIQSVYVSEVVKRRNRGSGTEYSELNFHLGGGKFHFVLRQEDPIDAATVPQPEQRPARTTDTVEELRSDTAYTDLQVAALYIADALGDLPAWYDLRVK